MCRHRTTISSLFLEMKENTRVTQFVLDFVTTLRLKSQDKHVSVENRTIWHAPLANIFISLNGRRWLHAVCSVIDRIKDATEYQIAIRLFRYRLFGSFRDIVFFAKAATRRARQYWKFSSSFTVTVNLIYVGMCFEKETLLGKSFRMNVSFESKVSRKTDARRKLWKLYWNKNKRKSIMICTFIRFICERYSIAYDNYNFQLRHLHLKRTRWIKRIILNLRFIFLSTRYKFFIYVLACSTRVGV